MMKLLYRQKNILVKTQFFIIFVFSFIFQHSAAIWCIFTGCLINVDLLVYV